MKLLSKRLAALAVAGMAGALVVAPAAFGTLTAKSEPMATVAASAPTPVPTTPKKPGLTARQKLRRQKCDYLWRKLYPWSYAPELVSFFCGEHERAGLPAMWWHSLVYGASGSGLNPRMTCRGGGLVSRGLMDCSWNFASDYRGHLEPLLSGSRPWGPGALYDPWVSIRCHVLELALYRQKTGRQHFSLLRKVFLPVAPDGGRSFREQRRWQRIEAKHRAALAPLLAQLANQTIQLAER